MKAITLWQPWASLVALRVKTIETRSWSTNHRGPLAIHAAQREPDEGLILGDWLTTRHPAVKLPGGEVLPRGRWFLVNMEDEEPHELHYPPLGCVVATCTLVDVVPIVGEDRGVGRVVQRVGDRLDLMPEKCVIEDTDRSDQLPYGDFTPGRFAWLLDGIEPVDPPVPARGRQRIWNWSPPA